MSRKPELRAIKNEQDLDELVVGDQIVINDKNNYSQKYVAVFVGKEEKNILKFISACVQKLDLLILQFINTPSIVYNGNGSISFRDHAREVLIFRSVDMKLCSEGEEQFYCAGNRARAIKSYECLNGCQNGACKEGL